MELSEMLFLGGFVVFIAAILLLDMFVIDKKAHELTKAGGISSSLSSQADAKVIIIYYKIVTKTLIFRLFKLV